MANPTERYCVWNNQYDAYGKTRAPQVQKEALLSIWKSMARTIRKAGWERGITRVALASWRETSSGVYI